MTNDELRDLLAPYRDTYPADADIDIATYTCACCFSRDEVNSIARWKFQTDRRRLTRTLNLLATNTDFDFQNLTSRALRNQDDLAALLLAMELNGVGKAFGSAILMAADPCRFSVLDYRAARALQALGYLTDCSTPTPENPAPWVRYLAAARDVAERTGWTLRNVDRALWEAGG